MLPLVRLGLKSGPLALAFHLIVQWLLSGALQLSSVTLPAPGPCLSRSLPLWHAIVSQFSLAVRLQIGEEPVHYGSSCSHLA